MDHAWDLDRGASSPIVVPVLDTGVAYRNALLRFDAPAFPMPGGMTLPALGQVEVPFAAAPDLGSGDRFVSQRDFIWNTTDPLDLDGPRTHASRTHGPLPNNG